MKEIYDRLRSWFDMCIYEGWLRSTHWIWVDFFKDEKTGYEYFVSELLKDEDYSDTDFENLEEDEIDVIVEDIKAKLSDSSFNSLMIQKQLDC